MGRRCFGDGEPLLERYHDEEWGFPVLDERGLFERLTLEAFQSGLSWRTILTKRDAFRDAFADFDPDAVARFGDADVQRLLGDRGIVRNRAKIEATLANARATLALRAAGSRSMGWSRRTRPCRRPCRPRPGRTYPRRRRKPWRSPASSSAAAFASWAPRRSTRSCKPAAWWTTISSAAPHDPRSSVRAVLPAWSTGKADSRCGAPSRCHADGKRV